MSLSATWRARVNQRQPQKKIISVFQFIVARPLIVHLRRGTFRECLRGAGQIASEVEIELLCSYSVGVVLVAAFGAFVVVARCQC